MDCFSGNIFDSYTTITALHLAPTACLCVVIQSPCWTLVYTTFQCILAHQPGSYRRKVKTVICFSLYFVVLVAIFIARMVQLSLSLPRRLSNRLGNFVYPRSGPSLTSPKGCVRKKTIQQDRTQNTGNSIMREYRRNHRGATSLGA